MRTAEDIVSEYRGRGYADARIRVLANNRDEPMRSAILACLSEEAVKNEESGAEAGSLLTEADLLDPVEMDSLPDVADLEAAEMEILAMEGDATDEELAEAVDESMETERIEDSIPDGQEDVEPDIEAIHIDMPVADAQDVDAEPIDIQDMDMQDMNIQDADIRDSDMQDRNPGEPDARAIQDEGETAAAIMDGSGAPHASLDERDLAWMAEIEEVEAGLENATSLDAWVENVLREAGMTPETIATIAGEAAELHALLDTPFAEDEEGEQIQVDDLACSTEMIREAYARIGIRLSESPSLGSVGTGWNTPEGHFAHPRDGALPYSQDAIRQTLRLIRCEVTGPDTGDDAGVIPLHPSYAVAPGTEAESDSATDSLDAVPYTLDALEAYGLGDEARARLGMRSEEDFLLPCADFDNLARPLPLPVRERRAPTMTAPDEASLLAQWWFDLDATGSRPAGRAWISAPTSLEAAWEEERAGWRMEMAELRRKLEDAGENLTLQTLLAQEREQACAEFQSRIDALTEELESIRSTNHGLEAHAVQVREVESLLDAARTELDAVSEQFAIMERAHNIAITETIPNLQADKSDLVELIHGQETETGTLRDELQGYRRRASYSMVAAAAAAMLVVLLPVFHFVAAPEAAPSAPDPILMAQLRQKDDAIEAMETERQTLTAQIREVQTRYQREQEHWENRLTALSLRGEERVRELQTRLHAMEGELVALREAAASTGGRDQMAGERLPYNNVTGVEEWQNRHHAQNRTGAGSGDRASTPVASGGAANPGSGSNAQRQREPGLVTTVPGRNPVAGTTPDPRIRKATVRRGEGLSQVLWRELGVTNPALIRHVAKTNNLRTDRNGHPVIHPGQELILPRSEEAALLR